MKVWMSNMFEMRPLLHCIGLSCRAPKLARSYFAASQAAILSTSLEQRTVHSCYGPRQMDSARSCIASRLVVVVVLRSKHACSNFPLRASRIHRRMQELNAHRVTGPSCV